MPVFSRIHVLVDDDTTVETRSNEAWVLLAEWNRRHQVALEFINVPTVDRLMVALAEIRERLTTGGAADAADIDSPANGPHGSLRAG